MGAPRVHFTDEQLAEIRERYEGGTDQRTLEREYGCSFSAMKRQLVLMGIYRPTERKTLTDAEVSEMDQRYRAGESTARLADAYGCNPETARKALMAYGTPIRSVRGRGVPVVFSPADEADIRDLYESGIGTRALAARYECNWYTMQKQLKRMGIYHPAKREPFTKAEKAEIGRRYKNGETPEAIGRSFHTGGAAVTKVLREAGAFDPDRYRYGRFKPHQVERMAERYNAGTTIYRLAKDYKCSVNGVWKVLVAHGVEMRFHGRVEGRRSVQGKYIRIQVDPSDPFAVAMAHANGFLPEHRLVMARKIGRPLEKHETVHHINGDTKDNRPENLQLRNGRHGKGVQMSCLDCGSHNVGAVPL